MPETAAQTATTATATTTLEGDPTFEDLKKRFIGRTTSDREKSEREEMIKGFADRILKDRNLIIPEDSERTIKSLIAEIDRKLSEQINLIMHHEDFKQMEGTWRGLRHLVYKSETDEMLKIKVVNISKKDL